MKILEQKNTEIAMNNRCFHEIVIIGAGVSGMTCALYLARANADVCLIGDYTTTPLLASPEVKNYPGIFNISGAEFLETLNRQVVESGATVVSANAMSPMCKDGKWIVLTDDGNVVDANYLVIATGSSARLLNLENEEEFIGKGVSICAYCDGPLYAGKNVCVVGTGTLAVEEAIYLSKICKHVTMIGRKDRLSTNAYTEEQLREYENISIKYDSPIAKIIRGDNNIMLVLAGHRARILTFDGIFYALGSIPNTEFLEGLCPLDEQKYINIPDQAESRHHIYACGDVNANNKYKQAVTAAADGCNTALQILQDLRNK